MKCTDVFHNQVHAQCIFSRFEVILPINFDKMIAKTPKPPYYAVIFSSINTNTLEDYSATAERMEELARQQDGFLGVESARNELGITVSYWKDLESIKAWKEHAEHTIARERGRSDWYASYMTRIAKVERDYGFDREP